MFCDIFVIWIFESPDFDDAKEGLQLFDLQQLKIWLSFDLSFMVKSNLNRFEGANIWADSLHLNTLE